MEETIPNYHKTHNPTEEHYQAVEEQNRKRRISCDEILRKHMEEQLKRRQEMLNPKKKKK